MGSNRARKITKGTDTRTMTLLSGRTFLEVESFNNIVYKHTAHECHQALENFQIWDINLKWCTKQSNQTKITTMKNVRNITKNCKTPFSFQFGHFFFNFHNSRVRMAIVAKTKQKRRKIARVENEMEWKEVVKLGEKHSI